MRKIIIYTLIGLGIITFSGCKKTEIHKNTVNTELDEQIVSIDYSNDDYILVCEALLKADNLGGEYVEAYLSNYSNYVTEELNNEIIAREEEREEMRDTEYKGTDDMTFLEEGYDNDNEVETDSTEEAIDEEFSFQVDPYTVESVDVARNCIVATVNMGTRMNKVMFWLADGKISGYIVYMEAA